MGVGAEPLEILVMLRDMTAGAFNKVKGNLTSLESKANSTNVSGFSRASKQMEKDATAAAGKEAKGGGGIGGLASGLLGLPGPLGIAVAGVGAFVAIGSAAAETADKVTAQQNLLDAAYKAHGSTLAANNDSLNRLIATGAKYGQNADAVRGAVLELVQAGHSQQDVEQSLTPIMDLAAAKHLDLATAAKQVQLAEMGNARALKDLGITLPKPTAAMTELTKATAASDKAHQALTNSQNALKLMEDSLAGKHKLTAAEALRLQIAHEKVKTAEDNLHAADTRLTAAQLANKKAGGEQAAVLGALEKAIGGSASAATDQQKAQASLSNAWEKFSMVVGPPLEALFSGLLNILAGVVSAIADFITWLGKAGDAVMNSPVGGFIKTVGGFVGGVGNAVGSVTGAIGNLIPHFATGGVVNPRPGGTLALLGEGGKREYIVPEGSTGSMGGGHTTHVIQVNLDGDVLARVVDEHLGRQASLLGGSSFAPVGA